MSDEEKRNTAFHEAGHAIVGVLVPDHDPVYKVTIIPRGRALGVTNTVGSRLQHVATQCCRSANTNLGTFGVIVCLLGLLITSAQQAFLQLIFCNLLSNTDAARRGVDARRNIQ